MSCDQPGTTSGKTKMARVYLEAGFTKLVEVGQRLVTRPAILLEKIGTTTTCRECNEPPYDLKPKPNGV